MIDITQELIDYEKNGLHHTLQQLNTENEHNEKKIFLLTTLDCILQLEELFEQQYLKNISYVKVNIEVNDQYNKDIELGNYINTMLQKNEPSLDTNISYDTYDIYVDMYDQSNNVIHPYEDDEKFMPLYTQINSLFQQLSMSVVFVKENTNIGSNESLTFKIDKHLGESLKNFLLSDELKVSLSYSLIQKQLQDKPQAKTKSKKI